jgi:membrane protease YdiL (CAAX protease family)
MMWRTAYRLRPFLSRLGASRRTADYLLIAWRGLASIAAVGLILQGTELVSGRNDLGAALREIGLTGSAPAEQLGMLSLLLFFVCYGINLGFWLLRQSLGIRPRPVTVNAMPQTALESFVFVLLLSPIAGISEELVFRGLFQSAFATWTGDPVSAVASQAVLFGILHMHQGGFGVLRTVSIGLVLGAGTLSCGSLVPAIVAHALIDAVIAIWRAPIASRA